jgi:hypothetical protein
MSDWCAHTVCQVELGFAGPRHGIPPGGQPMVPQLAGPGSLGRINYGTSPYRVIAVKGKMAAMLTG